MNNEILYTSKFFTNQNQNTLSNKINHILKNRLQITHLDFLIGYFRISGFDKIANFLPNITKARILVGINIDKPIYDATQIVKIFSKEQIKYLQKNSSSLDLLASLIIQNKVVVKISPQRDVHAKMYIFRDEGSLDHTGDKIEYQGSVIIGSSNLTYRGLEGSFEINTEIEDRHYVKDGVELFDELWESAVELTLEDIDRYIRPFVKPRESSISPYELYIKLLIEHFGSRIDFLDDEGIFVPKEYKKLSYQVEAVNDGISKLKEHNGFFLSDVVGLGKTVVVAMLIKKLQNSLESEALAPNITRLKPSFPSFRKSLLKKNILVVIPPAVKTQWEDTFKEFEISNYEIVSLASLHKVESNKYEVIIVDESHKFKNSESKRYKQLYEICLNKKVILLSATPQNNTPRDLYNQIALFQNVKNSTIESCFNLQSFFTGKEREYKDIINLDSGIDESTLKLLSEEIRDNVLRTIMIRRTRYDIEHHSMYKADIEAQNLSIPKVKEPQEHEYKLQANLGTIFDATAIKITKGLNYSRFNALSYLTDDAKVKYYPNESDNIFSKNPLSGIMKVLLVKRFESSFSAFKISIERHLKRYTTFIENFEDNRVYLGKKASDILDYDRELDGDYEQFIERLKEAKKVRVLEKKDFKKSFIDDLKSDREIFEKLVDVWKDIEQDPKLDKFIEVLGEDKGRKIVIFTESVDTLNYLKEKLESEALAPNKILFITSQNRDDKKQIIKENFDANYDKQKDDYNIIITTDTLAEGINLHRANIIYNYDIPWNATKLIQRIGRVNRIGSRADYIYIHNFKPASPIEELIQLSQKAFVKLQSSHTMMGEDSQIYSKDESVGTVNLFNEYKKEANEKDEELDYLVEIREFRDENEKEFNRISELNEKLILTRKGRVESAYVVLDINNHKNYVYVDEDITRPIALIEIAKALKANPDEIALVSDKGKNQKYISRAIGYFEDEFKRKKQDRAENRVDVKSDKRALNFLNEWFIAEYIDEKSIDSCEELINSGKLFNLSKQIVELKNISSEEIQKRLHEIITNITVAENGNVIENKIRIVLSELFSKVD